MADEDRQLFQQIIATFDSPAYMRPARDVEAAWNEIQLSCQREYESHLEMPLLRLARLLSIVSEKIDELLPLFPEACCHEIIAELKDLSGRWADRLNPLLGRFQPREPGVGAKEVLSRFLFSCQRFNHHWTECVPQVDLTEVNRLRRDYNEYYLLEKECVVHSPAVARLGYQPLTPATHEELLKFFPCLCPSAVCSLGESF